MFMNTTADCSIGNGLARDMLLCCKVASVQQRLFRFSARSHAKSDYYAAFCLSVRLPSWNNCAAAGHATLH